MVTVAARLCRFRAGKQFAELVGDVAIEWLSALMIPRKTSSKKRKGLKFTFPGCDGLRKRFQKSRRKDLPKTKSMKKPNENGGENAPILMDSDAPSFYRAAFGVTEEPLRIRITAKDAQGRCFTMLDSSLPRAMLVMELFIEKRDGPTSKATCCSELDLTAPQRWNWGEHASRPARGLDYSAGR